ncbi:MAG: 2-oxo acid dehydrogenase subunit E2, partial [Verrucomicrobiota bacterium]
VRLSNPLWRQQIDVVFELFPRLKERRTQAAGTLSGGERQMLAVGRALMSRPTLLMLDEPSLGLAPLVVIEIFRTIAALRETGVTTLLVEQNARAALEAADYGYVRETGRIVMEDVRSYIQRLQRLASQPKAAAEPGQPKQVVAESIDFSKWGPVSKKPMSSLRQIISRRMTENWNAIPHVTQFDDADITALNELRKEHAAAYEAKGTRLTLTPFVVKAVAETLKKHPIFNSSLDEASQEIVLKEYVHIGIAVDTEAGLIVPVIRDADRKSILEISRELEDLARRARDRKVSGDELKGGTFTISNQGGIGGAHFTPIINKPEVAILGLGRGALKAVVRGGNIEPRLMMPIGLSYDHRVIDGGIAARFTVDLIKAIEQFRDEDAVLA